MIHTGFDRLPHSSRPFAQADRQWCVYGIVPAMLNESNYEKNITRPWFERTGV